MARRPLKEPGSDINTNDKREKGEPEKQRRDRERKVREQVREPALFFFFFFC